VTCSFAGCGRKHHAKGLCNGHHKQSLRGEHLAELKITRQSALALMGLTFRDFFWSKTLGCVRTGCIEWMGSRDKLGYGRLVVTGSSVLAHRKAWELERATVPEGLHVCHKCDNPPCVNPDHLFIGTHVDNMMDKHGKGRCRTVTGELSKSKLTEAAVREIRADKISLVKDLAAKFGVRPNTISMVRTGRNWRHVKP
jgi:HNH endonuclease